jgi:Tetratricopeptide repeat/Domain of unknown function (DUF4062)
MDTQASPAVGGLRGVVPSKITAYRIFIASPRGLEPERQHFREVIQSYNEEGVIERDLLFLPVGWEATLAGVGRPQETINEEVRRSDYFLMLLWDRWGSFTGDPDARFTSGAEEEFSVAQTCHRNGTMRQIVVMFKEVELNRLADAGPELSKVLDFRKELEAKKSLLYERFDAPGAFESKLRRHLARWVLDHEKGRGTGGAGAPVPSEPVPPPPAPGVPVEAPPQASPSPAIRGAEELASAGRVTEAEQVFARGVRDGDLDAINRYGRFLIDSGSFASAEKTFVQLTGLARQGGQRDWLVAGLNNLGKLYVVQGELQKAESTYREALALRETMLGPDHPDVAVSLNNLAEVYAGLRRYGEAEPLFRRALEIQGVPLEL